MTWLYYYYHSVLVPISLGGMGSLAITEIMPCVSPTLLYTLYQATCPRGMFLVFVILRVLCEPFLSSSLSAPSPSPNMLAEGHMLVSNILFSIEIVNANNWRSLIGFCGPTAPVLWVECPTRDYVWVPLPARHAPWWGLPYGGNTCTACNACVALPAAEESNILFRGFFGVGTARPQRVTVDCRFQCLFICPSCLD